MAEEKREVLVYRGRWLILALTLVVGLGAALYGSGVVGALSPGGFSVQDGEAETMARLVRERLELGEPDLVALVEVPGLRAGEPGFEAAVGQLVERAGADPDVVSVLSPLGPGGRAMVSADGRTAMITMDLVEDPERRAAAFDRLEGALALEGARVLVGGELAAEVTAQRIAESDLVRAELVALPVLALLLLVFFRGVVAAALPLLVGALAIGFATASLRGLAHAMPVAVFALNIVTFLGLGLAIDYSLFVVERFREELRAGSSVPEAVRRTLETSGKTVLFSGGAVAASLLALLWFPVGLLRSIAFGGALVVATAVLAATVVLPAVLSVVGHRVGAWTVRRRSRRASARWFDLGRRVTRRPALVAVVVGLGLLSAGLPMFWMETALSDARLFPRSFEVRRVQERLWAESGFAHLGRSRVTVVARTEGPALAPDNLARIRELERSLAALPGVSGVLGLSQAVDAAGGEAPVSPGAAAALSRIVRDDLSTAVVVSAHRPGTPEARALVQEVRRVAPAGLTLGLSGQAAADEEVLRAMVGGLPAAAATVAAATFLVLLLAFGAVPVALKAIVVNALSLTVSFAVLVVVFQAGRLEGLLAYDAVGTIDPVVPVVMFAIVYGLSMDYELFLLSRIKEDFVRSGSARGSIARGLGQTAGIITAAALMLAVVLAAFGTGRILIVRELGVGMVLAVAIDATLIRGLLVPATMALLGRRAWWAPPRLRSLWSRSHVGIREDAAGPARA